MKKSIFLGFINISSWIFQRIIIIFKYAVNSDLIYIYYSKLLENYRFYINFSGIFFRILMLYALLPRKEFSYLEIFKYFINFNFFNHQNPSSLRPPLPTRLQRISFCRRTATLLASTLSPSLRLLVSFPQTAFTVSHQPRSKRMAMGIFEPYRAIGCITTNVPVSVKRLGTETFVTVSVGKAWHSYNVCFYYLSHST